MAVTGADYESISGGTPQEFVITIYENGGAWPIMPVDTFDMLQYKVISREAQSYPLIIQGSNDGSTWTDVLTYSSTNVMNDFEDLMPYIENYKLMRFYSTARSYTNGVQIKARSKTV